MDSFPRESGRQGGGSAGAAEDVSSGQGSGERFTPVVLKAQEHYLEGSSPRRLPGPLLRVSDSVGLEWGLRICVSAVFRNCW